MTAFGSRERIVTSVLIDADSSDQGKLGPAVEDALRALREARIDVEQPIQIAADAGYTAAADLVFAHENREQVDLLVAQPKHSRYKPKKGGGLFTKDDFEWSDDGPICPAGSPMEGPESDGVGRTRFKGLGCETCSLHDKCTKSKRRVLVIRPKLENARASMTTRMSEQGAADRYNQRIATIEPVFGELQHAMNYRRVSSRHKDGIRAEILLKVLAYNLRRLLAAEARAFVLVLDIQF